MDKCEYNLRNCIFEGAKNFISSLVVRELIKRWTVDTIKRRSCLLAGALGDRDTGDNLTDEDTIEAESNVSNDNLDQEKKVIPTRKKILNCGKDGDDVHNLSRDRNVIFRLHSRFLCCNIVIHSGIGISDTYTTSNDDRVLYLRVLKRCLLIQ